MTFLPVDQDVWWLLEVGCWHPPSGAQGRDITRSNVDAQLALLMGQVKVNNNKCCVTIFFCKTEGWSEISNRKKEVACFDLSPVVNICVNKYSCEYSRLQAGPLYNGAPPYGLRGFIGDHTQRILGYATLRYKLKGTWNTGSHLANCQF